MGSRNTLNYFCYNLSSQVPRDLVYFGGMERRLFFWCDFLLLYFCPYPDIFGFTSVFVVRRLGLRSQYCRDCFHLSERKKRVVNTIAILRTWELVE
jgi:hypothetical protein